MMLTGRAATAADRLASLGERLRQLDDRLHRLQSGDRPSADDLRTARGFAEEQQLRAVEAQRLLDRLRSTHTEDGSSDLATAMGGDDPAAEALAEHRPTDWYWRAIVDQARRDGWRDWGGAFCRVATAALPSVRGVAISVCIDRLPAPIAISDEWTAELDDAERVLGEGPATTAYATGRPVVARIDDPADETWIAWSRLAVGWGAREIWSFPHSCEAVGLLAVTFYRSHVVAAPDDRRQAWLLSGLAARTLRADAYRAEQSELQLPDPVDVATGVLAERLRASPGDAYARIRAHAFVAGQRLSTIAREIINGRLELD